MSGPYDHDRKKLEKLKGMVVEDHREGITWLPQYAGDVYVPPGMLDDIRCMKTFWKPSTLGQLDDYEYSRFIGYVGNGDGRWISIYEMV